MREMVLNHASIVAPCADRGLIREWIKDVVSGMGQLVRDQVVRKSLRMFGNPYDTPCLPDYSFFNAYQDLQQAGYRDEYVFLMQLTTKMPLLDEVGEDVKDRFLACEALTLPAGDGDPLVLCAVSDGISVGFPSNPEWDHDRVTVRFRELLPDETFAEASETIDQLTRSGHAGPICTRHRAQLRAGSDPRTLWQTRQAIFPHLIFGPGIEANLLKSAHLFQPIVAKLVALDLSAQEWRNVGGTVPPWRTRVTPESNGVKNDPSLLNARRFPSHLGTPQIFEWHARFGGSGRIHLRFDPNSREVEIGYIGPHLPL